jgi:hypothetical protein
MEILKELKKNNAFNTISWQGRTDKEKEDFVQLIGQSFPNEIIKDILLTSRSQIESSPFISLDSGEIYINLKKDSNVECLLDVNLEQFSFCEHLIIFFKTKNPLEYEIFRSKMNQLNDKIKNWTFCTIPSNEESVDAIVFLDKLMGVGL